MSRYWWSDVLSNLCQVTAELVPRDCFGSLRDTSSLNGMAAPWFSYLRQRSWCVWLPDEDNRHGISTRVENLILFTISRLQKYCRDTINRASSLAIKWCFKSSAALKMSCTSHACYILMTVRFLAKGHCLALARAETMLEGEHSEYSRWKATEIIPRKKGM